MGSIKLIEVYQDVMDVKDQRYISPVDNIDDGNGGIYSQNDDVTEPIEVSHLYNRVIDEKNADESMDHIYESLYNFSHIRRMNGDKAPSPSHSPLKCDPVKSNAKKFTLPKKQINAAKDNRAPLTDCSNWTLSSTCGEKFFIVSEHGSTASYKKLNASNKNEGRASTKHNDDNNNMSGSQNNGNDNKSAYVEKKKTRSCKNILNFWRNSSISNDGEQFFTSNMEGKEKLKVI